MADEGSYYSPWKAAKKADEAAFYGTWKIVECISLAGIEETSGIEGSCQDGGVVLTSIPVVPLDKQLPGVGTIHGTTMPGLKTEFHLDESGDVTWKVADNTEGMPFFTCESYEVSLEDPAVLKFFGTFAGHIIEFRVEVSDDLMLLTCERCCMLQCKKVASVDPKTEFPFSFVSALEEGYFSDLTITADNGREFRVHKFILNMSNSNLDWSKSPPPLSGLPEDVIYLILFYLYSECLPRSLHEDTARQCLKVVSKLPGFTRLAEMCEMFLKNTALKQQIINLVTDMHTCADRIIDYFHGKGTSSDPNHSPPGDSLVSNPAKLCYVVKQALRDGAVAGVKLLILCDLFSRRKGELSREECHEIIKYAKSRLPIFMNQLHKFLEVCKQNFSDLTFSQRHEIATYLVPEIETTLEMLSQFVIETKTALEQVINSSNMTEKTVPLDKNKKGNVGDILGRSLRKALHARELMKLKNFREKITVSLQNLVHKKENFSDMSVGNKVRSVAKNLEQLIDEVPMFLLRLEELKSALDEKLKWREWKYLFKLGTSKVTWVLSKLIAHRSALKSMLAQSCSMVHREQFTQSLIMLGLLDPPQGAVDAVTVTNTTTNTTTTTTTNNIPIPKTVTPTAKNKATQFSSVESLSIPLLAHKSSLARKAAELLASGLETDMSFEIISVQDVGDTIIDHSRGEPVDCTQHEHEVNIHEIKAHCVVIASQCDWFRRALLSGMRESIDKKIVVHDTNPALFKVFLQYLYSGQLDSAQLSTEQIADLMLLSDRYEMDNLKQICEHALKLQIDEDSTLFLLSLADQFQARSLRNAALDFVRDHPEVMESDVFYELPDHLQAEVEETVAWRGLDTSSRHFNHSQTETPSSVSSIGEIEDLTAALSISGHENECSDSSSLDELPMTQDAARLEGCIAQLRDVLGESVPREDMVSIILAADYDVNRAINFYYSA